MRVLHVLDHSLPLQSGYVTRTLAILRAQRARGWETVHLTSPRHGFYAGRGETTEVFDGLAFERTRPVGMTYPLLREIAEMRATGERLAALVRSSRPDIIHAHSPVLNALPALAIGRRFGVPVVYEVRALWEDASVDLGRSREGSARYRLARWLDTRALRRADRIVAICEALRHEIVARGIPADRVTVVPNAVDPMFLAPHAPADAALRRSLGLEGKSVLGFIGSFYAYEGLDLLVEAMLPLLRWRGDLAVLLVGGGPERERIEALVRRHGLEEHVRLLGRVKHEDVPRYYALVDLFVFPRRKMRLTDLVTPLKPLEAMAQGKPVLASDVGGHRELIRAGETGFLFPPGDPAALAAAVEHALADPALLARIVANGRRFVEVERNWTAVCERYTTVYDALVAKRRRPN